MKSFWDSRYRQNEYIYGKAPNQYFERKIKKLTAGKILLPAEGEGRNAVYAAALDWDVFATDQSDFAKNKALELAGEAGVKIHYNVSDISQFDPGSSQFDVVGFIYAHFPSDLIIPQYQRLLTYLKSGGWVIFEAFSKQQLQFQQANENAGGPRNIDMLFDLALVQSIFKEFKIFELEEKDIDLDEGRYHQGRSSVIRLFAEKL